MSDIQITMFRRYATDVSREDVLRGLLQGVEWYREQSEAISQLHVGRYVFLRDAGLLAHGCVTASGNPFWRVSFESLVVDQGLVMVEVVNDTVGVLAWMRQLYRWMTDGCWEEHIRQQESAYRKRLRAALTRSVKDTEWVSGDELARALGSGVASVSGEYLNVLALMNYFGSGATHRQTYKPSKFSIPESDYFMDRLGRWFYEPWVEMKGSTQPEEVISMVTFLRLVYESSYRKLLRELGDDLTPDMLRVFTDTFESSLIEVLRSETLPWGNSLLPQFMSYMVGADANIHGL